MEKEQALALKIEKRFLQEPQACLKELLIERKRQNKHFSSRAFARELGVSPAFLSQVLSGARNMSLKQTLKIAEALDLKIKTSVGSKKMASHYVKQITIGLEHDKILKYPYHLAILELARIDGIKLNASLAARRLNLSTLEASSAIDRLIQFGYLERAVGGVVTRTNVPVRFQTTVTGPAVRAFHESALQAGLTELGHIDAESVQNRHFSSSVVASSRKKIEAARVRIRKFNDELLQFLTEGPHEEVLQWNTQLFSAEKKLSKKET